MGPDVRDLERTFDELAEQHRLSGVMTVHRGGELLAGRAYGFANRSEGIPNTLETRFQVASGSKIFTSVAVCRLVEKGVLSFDMRLADCLDAEFPHFDPGVTLHHLLTHTSGIPDYFREEEGEDYESLWRNTPMYRMTSPRDFLDLFRNGMMQFAPGARFSYNDAAFILLAAIVERNAGAPFADHVTENVLAPAGMHDSGYYRFDRLPPRTAFAYIEDEAGTSWRTNIYAVPVIGGGDGGAYVTAPDMMCFWRALHRHDLLEEATTAALLRPHVEARGTATPTRYGYGVWIMSDGGGAPVPYVEGWDPGVSFLSAWYPAREIAVTLALNSNRSVWLVFDSIRNLVEVI